MCSKQTLTERQSEFHLSQASLIMNSSWRLIAMSPEQKKNKIPRVLAFFLNGCECGKFIGGAERRFFEISIQLKALGLQFFALEYESLHSERYGQVGYFPIKIKRRFANNSILNCLRLSMLGSFICMKNKCDIIYVTIMDSWMETSWAGLIAPYLVSTICRKPLAIIFHHLEPRHLTDRNPLKLMAIRKSTRIAVSKATARDVRRYFNVKDVFIVGNGINRQLFDVKNNKSRKYDAAFHGRIAEDKGIFELLRAWKIVVSKMPAARLLLVGGVDKALETEISKTLTQLHMEKSVFMTGFVTDRKLIQLLESSKIFVLPSRAEGFSLSVAEAMAIGLPCIVPDLPALKEFYSSTAVFAEPRNIESFAQAIVSLLSNPEKCDELREKGKKLVEQFSWSGAAAKEYDVLSHVSASSARPCMFAQA